MELGEIVANAQDNETCLWNLVNGDGNDGNNGGDCHGRETCLSSMAASEIWSTILKPRGANQEAAYWTPVFTLLAPLPGKTNQFPQVTTNSTKHGKKESNSCLYFDSSATWKEKPVCFKQRQKNKTKSCLFQTKTKAKVVSLMLKSDPARRLRWLRFHFFSTHQKNFNSRNIFSTHQTLL